jgi:hypothetical protein
VRSADLVPAPASIDSNDTANLIRSEDTDFGSDISRGAVREGVLYSYRPTASPLVPKSRPDHQQKSDSRPPQEEKSEKAQQRGVLRIQPGVLDQPKQQPPGHRGGLLFIDSNAIKSTANNNTKSVAPRGYQSSEFNRNVVPLRKETEQPQTRMVWNPDSIPTRISPNTMSLHSGPRLILTPDEILREVKRAYQDIQNLERKIKAIYDSQDEGLEIARMQRRTTSDTVSWSTYSNTHREYLPVY